MSTHPVPSASPAPMDYAQDNIQPVQMENAQPAQSEKAQAMYAETAISAEPAVPPPAYTSAYSKTNQMVPDPKYVKSKSEVNIAKLETVRRQHINQLG